MNLAGLSAWFRTHKRAAAVAGVGGAAGVALIARGRKGSTSSTTGNPSSIGQVSGDPADLVNSVTRQLQPQLDALANQVANLTPAPTPKPTPTPNPSRHVQHLQHVAHVQHTEIQTLRREATVRGDPSQVRNAADVALLTPAQRADFNRYLAGQQTSPADRFGKATTLPAFNKPAPAK